MAQRLFIAALILAIGVAAALLAWNVLLPFGGLGGCEVDVSKCYFFATLCRRDRRFL